MSGGKKNDKWALMSVFKRRMFNVDFKLTLWKEKIKALLGHQKAAKALLDPSELPTTITTIQKKEMELNAYGTLILNLSDNIIRQVQEEETTHKVWKKLKSLYHQRPSEQDVSKRKKFHI